MKYLHSMIRVNNLENSLRFYKELLGLKLQSKKDLDDCTLYFLAEYEGGPEIFFMVFIVTFASPCSICPM